MGYKFKITDNARKQQGCCNRCGEDGIPWKELTEWGLCGRCYAWTLEEILLEILSSDGRASAFRKRDELVNEALARYRVVREKAPKGWIPGMD